MNTLDSKRRKMKRNAICSTCVWTTTLVVGLISLLVILHLHEHYRDRLAYNTSLQKTAETVWELTCKGRQVDPYANEYIKCDHALYDSKMNVNLRSKEEAMDELRQHINILSWVCNSGECTNIIWDLIHQISGWGGAIICLSVFFGIVCVFFVCGPLLSIYRYNLAARECKLSQNRQQRVTESFTLFKDTE
jgi:hypothetical protein